MSVSESEQAEKISAAVESALSSGTEASDAEKLAQAQGVYLAWRNANLGALPPAAFAVVEASSGALISAIAGLL